jgi:hypothetical protein
LTVDILDETHALSLAMRKLAENATLRLELGQNGRELWQRRFRLDQMVERYAAVLEAIIGASDAPTLPDLPSHLTSDGMEHAAGVLKAAGFAGYPTADLWTRRTE